MNRLARYLGTEIAIYSCSTLAALSGIFVFFDLLGEVDNIGKGNYQFIDVIVYVLLSMPGHVYELLPVSALIGGVYALSHLAENSELTVMRASGVSMLRLTGWLVIVGAMFALATGLLGEYIAPNASHAASRYRIQSTKEIMVGDFQSGIWIKDGKQITNITAMLPDLTLRGLRIYEFDTQQRLERITDASHARFNRQNNHWELSNVTLTTFPSDQEKVQLTHPAAMVWDTDVNPDMLAVLMVKPREMSMRSLSGYISHLRENGQNAARYELSLWTKIFYPIACISMMLIALPFALLQRRSGGMGTKIFVGILLGVGFNFLNQIMGNLGALYRLPAPLAAALPTLLLLTCTGYVLWRQSKT